MGQALLGTLVVAIVSVFSLATANAAEKKSGQAPKGEAVSAEEQMDALVQLGSGCHRIKKDAKAV